jgi:hypothetical protein
LRRALESEPVNLARIHSLIQIAKDDGLALDRSELGYYIDLCMKHALVNLQAAPLDADRLERAVELARALREFPFRLNIWQAQNIWYDTLAESPRLLKDLRPAAVDRWRERFLELGRQMGVAVEELVVEDSVSPQIDQSPKV